jgi:hypothetical protein
MVPGKMKFLCISIEFHHMCTPETMIYIHYGTIWLHGRRYSSSAAEYMPAWSRLDLIDVESASPIGLFLRVNLS